MDNRDGVRHDRCARPPREDLRGWIRQCRWWGAGARADRDGGAGAARARRGRMAARHTDDRGLVRYPGWVRLLRRDGIGVPIVARWCAARESSRPCGGDRRGEREGCGRTATVRLAVVVGLIWVDGAHRVGRARATNQTTSLRADR